MQSSLLPLRRYKILFLLLVALKDNLNTRKLPSFFGLLLLFAIYSFIYYCLSLLYEYLFYLFFTYTHIHKPYTYTICTRVREHIRITYVHMYTCARTYTYNMYICTHVREHICITYVYMYTCTYA